MNRWYAFSQLVLTRFREFFREPEVVFWVYGFPLILAVGLGLAFSGGKPDPPAVDIVGPSSRATTLAEVLRAADMKVEIHPEAECKERLRMGKTALFVSVDGDTLSYVYDDTRAESLLARHWTEELWLRHKTNKTVNAVPPSQEHFQQESGSRYIDFLVPGLMGMNLMGGGLFGVGFLLVDMRVRKLFKRLLATPMRRTDFLLAILTARMVFLIPEMLVLLAVGHLIYGVPIAGHPLTLLLVIVLGAVQFAALGLLLGCRTEKLETASGLVNLVMLPMYLFGGIFFSSKRFPDEAQPYIQALPLTQLNDALREVMLEGRGLADIAWRLGIMAIWTVIPLALALKWFRWR